MRKRLLAAVTTVAVLATGVGVAFAENVYTVDSASSTPAGKGTLAKPIPAQLKFGYEVGDTENLRPSVITQYRIAPEGLVTYPKLFPTCSPAQVGVGAEIPEPAAACKKALLGEGIVRNAFGSVTDRTAKGPCTLKLRLYNLSGQGRNGGMGIRLDGGPGQPPSPGCPLPIDRVIPAKFFTVKLQGLKTSELRFDVPRELYRPEQTVQNAVIDVSSTVKKRTARTRIKGKRRTVGYYSKIGCKGNRRQVRVQFVTLEGDRKTATKEGRC